MRRARHRSLVTALTRALALVLAVVASVTVLPVGPASASPAQLQAREWWIARLGLEQAWKITEGRGVTVAVLDVGVDPTIGDLRGAVVPGFTVGGSGSPDRNHDSGDGHGTSMALDIAGRGISPGLKGIAPQAKIMPVYLAGGNSSFVEALNRLSAMPTPPQVVNMSFGGDAPCDPQMQDAVARAVGRGMILVASAGNSGLGTNPTQYPSNCKGVVAVGAFDVDAKPWSGGQRQPYISLGGPGVNIVTVNAARETGHGDGTSAAAAMVSGQFALLRAKFPTMPSRQLVARMFATAAGYVYSGPGYGQPGDQLGFGPARVHHALIDPVPANAPNPVYDDLAKVTASASSGASGSPADPQSGPASAPRSDVHVDFPGTGGDAGSSSSSGSNTGLIAGIIAAAVVLLVVVVLLLRRRRRPTGPIGPSGPWGPQ